MTVRSSFPLGELFPLMGLLGEHGNLAEILVSGLASVENCKEGDLVFLSQDRLLPLAKGKKPSAFVVSETCFSQAQEACLQAPLLRSNDAMLAFAKVSEKFQIEPRPEPGIHPTAFVHPSVKLGKNVSIAPHVTVAEGAELQDGVILHSGVRIGARAHIGKHSTIFSGVVIYHDVRIGNHTRIHGNSVIGADGFGYVQEKTPHGVTHVKIHHLGTVRIGNHVEIGASTTIDRGTLNDTIIEDGCIIDNQVQIGHNCHLEKGVIVCGCTGIAGSAHIEKFALLAGFVAVGNKVRIGAGAQIAGLTAVNASVPAGAKWGGIPGMPRSEYARLQILFMRLPELFQKKKKETKV
jgi:UDP-3-O-[3-hydroxymyristoyl] glucosamine N-acyltransferase